MSYKQIFSINAKPAICEEVIKNSSDIDEIRQVEQKENFDAWYTEPYGKGDKLIKSEVHFEGNMTYMYYEHDLGDESDDPFDPELPPDPEWPVDPVDPDTPDPEEPEEPEDPDTPVDPEDPFDPEDTDTPVDPDPDEPFDPELPDEPIVGKAYNVSFLDADNTLLSSKLYAAGAIPSDNQARSALSIPYTYQFTGWDKEIVPVVDDAVYQAKYIQNIDDIKYTVRFYDGDTLLDTQQVTYRGSATAPDVTKVDYTFDGWDVSFDNIIKDTDVYAQWSENVVEDGTYTISFYDVQYNVVFKDDAGTVLDDRYYMGGSELIVPTATKEGYYFDNWLANGEKALLPKKVISDAEYVASYKRPTVTYFDYAGGKIIKTESVNVGGSSNPPATPDRGEYYIFNGWSKSEEELSNITEDIIVYGLWHVDTSKVNIWTGAAHYNSNSLAIYGLDPNSGTWCPCCDDYGKSNLVVDGKNVPTIEWRLKSYVTTDASKASDAAPINGLLFNGTDTLYKTTKPDSNHDYACFAVGKNSSTFSWNGAGAGIVVGNLSGILPGENNDIVAFIRIYVQDEFQDVGWDFHSCYGPQGVSINRNGSGEINLVNGLAGTGNLAYDNADIPNGKLESGKLYVLYDTKHSRLGVRNLTDDDKKYLTGTSFVTSIALKSESNDDIICSINTPDGEVSKSFTISELKAAGVEFKEDLTYDAPIDTEIMNGELKYTFTTDCILSIDKTINNPYVFKAGTTINIAYYSGCTFIKYVR